MSDDIQLDLNDSAPAKKTKTVKPTLAETLYAQRLSAGLHPDVSLDDETVTEGVGAAMVVVEPQHSNAAPMPNERDLINQLLGQAQAAKAISQFSRTIGISKLAYVKESKSYKALKGMNPNGTELSGTWAEFCGLLDMSVDKADLDISNLKMFGEEALESMTRMGIGYRDLAQYRKLPDDEKTALIEAAKSGDKDQLLDLAESLIEKHIKEKSELTEKAAELEQGLKDSGKRINNMNAEIERQEMQLERLGKKKERLTKFEEFTEDVRDECMYLQAGCELNLNSLHKLFDDCMYGEGADTPEQQLRIEQVYVAVSVAASRAVTTLELMRDVIPEANRPVRIQGQHILTPAEAERWLLDAQMLESKHEAEKLSRNVKRDADKPKGRGRPAGSKNKAEE
jgi:hypothetical protein